MTLAWNDVVELVALAAVYDQRKADDLDVKAWAQVANRQRWTAAAATAVIVEHYSRGADRPRITPAQISDRIREIRAAAAASFAAPRIPDDLPNATYPAWLRGQRDRHVDTIVTRWAVDGAEPPRELAAGPAPDPVGQARYAQLTAGAFTAIGAGPDDDPGDTRRRTALDHPCPHCHAQPGEPCTRSSAGGRARLAAVHPSRREIS